MTSSNGTIFRVTGPLYGEFTGPGEFQAQRPVKRSLMFSLICAWINNWVNNREAGDLRRHRGHYYVNVMLHYESSKASHNRWRTIEYHALQENAYQSFILLPGKCMKSMIGFKIIKINGIVYVLHHWPCFKEADANMCQDYVYIKWEYWNIM